MRPEKRPFPDLRTYTTVIVSNHALQNLFTLLVQDPRSQEEEIEVQGVLIGELFCTVSNLTRTMW